MRCKNCGADNDDNRYICEVCGSPLYDEDDIEKIEAADNEKTQTFKAVNENKNSSEQYASNGSDKYYNESNQDDYEYEEPQRNSSNDDEHKSTEKKSIIVIAILAVILIAIIASVVAIAHNKNADKKETTNELTKISSLADDSNENENRLHTKNSTTKKNKTTKETTKQTTTEKTTKPTTANLWIINTSSSGGGETEGDGKYENGKTVTLFARADDGYKFDGWYSDGVKVSDSEEYSFTANENASFSAVFSPIETEPATTTAPQTTVAVDTQLPSDTTSEINFGE